MCEYLISTAVRYMNLMFIKSSYIYLIRLIFVLISNNADHGQVVVHLLLK